MAELDTSQGGKHGKGKKKGKKMSTRVDLTPMVDLGFLLVTFFMLTTTFSKPQTMEINLPVKPKGGDVEEASQGVKASESLTILLGSENKVFYYQGVGDANADVKASNFSKDGIRTVLQEKNRTVKNLIVLIKASDEATYKNMVDALDEMNICGIKRYALVDITPTDLDLIKKL